RLSGIQNAHRQTRDGGGILRGERGGAGERLQQIQRGALAGQQGACRALQFTEYLVRLHAVAVAPVPVHLYTFVEFREHRIEPITAAHDGLFAADDAGFRLRSLRDQRGRDIAAANVLRERAAHGRLDLVFDGLEPHYSEISSSSMSNNSVALGGITPPAP